MIQPKKQKSTQLNPIAQMLLDQSSTYGLIESYRDGTRYKPQDIIGSLPKGLAQLATVPLEIADKERKNFKEFSQNSRRGKVLKPRSLPMNARVQDEIPVMANGGKIDPPIKSKGLNPIQQKEAEEDLAWTNNWNANRVVEGNKLDGYQIPNTQKVIGRNLNPKGVDTSVEFIKMAEYNPNNDQISVDSNLYETGLGLTSHEYGHRFQKYTKNRSPKVYEKYINKPITDVIPNKGTYDTDPEEIHSELMRFRRNNNYKPDQIITDEDIDKVQDTDYNFNNMSQDNLVKLLNTTADINTPSSVPVVAYGGSINTLNNNNMFAKVNRRKIPKMATGGSTSAMLGTAGSVASLVPGIGTAVGAGLSIASGIMAQSEAEKAERERQKLIQAQQLQQDSMELANYNQVGNAGVQYYATGGALPSSTTNGSPAVGGELVPIDGNTELVVGNKHEENAIDGEYGVTIADENGVPKANVEDQEVIKDGDYVFSDRLKSSDGTTFANRILKLTKRKVKIEDKLKDATTNRHTDGYNRMLEGIQLQESQLQEEQEFVKLLEPNTDETMTPKFAKGGKIKRYAYGGDIDPMKPLGYVNPLPSVSGSVPYQYINAPSTTALQGDYPNITAESAYGNGDEGEFDLSRFAGNLAPTLIDNVGNLILNSKTPKLPIPQLAKAKRLDPTVNIDPQLMAINQAVNTGVDNIMGNTSNSNVARSNIANLRLRGMESKVGLLGNRENQERAIRNSNTQNEQSINNQNAVTMNNFNNNNFTRTNEINSRNSANLANFSSDLSEAMDRTTLQNNDDETMLLSLMDDKTGAKMRAMERNPYFAKNPKLKAAIKAEVARRKLLNNKSNS